MTLNNKVYDVLKWVCIIFLPALSVFYCALDKAFGLGYADIVMTVLAALGTFIGSLIGISAVSYKEEG